MEQSGYVVLVVDDDEVIRRLLRDILEAKGYGVQEAGDGVEALACLAAQSFDMVISDIQMPRCNGFELFESMGQHYPGVKRVLMTGSDIDEQLDAVRRYEVGNILSKGGRIHVGEIGDYIGRLLSGEVFGLHRYLEGARIESGTIRTSADVESVMEQVMGMFEGSAAVFAEMALNELISNAIFHGILQMSDLPRERWDGAFCLDEHTPLRVSWGVDGQKVGVAVADPMGMLRKKDVLRWLDHRVDEQLVGEEEHGRGLLLVRKLMDRFIINIARGSQTECIMLHYFDRSVGRQHKPLLVHEV
jgi:CheY-like chemotaxis protein